MAKEAYIIVVNHDNETDGVVTFTIEGKELLIHMEVGGREVYGHAYLDAARSAFREIQAGE